MKTLKGNIDMLNEEAYDKVQSLDGMSFNHSVRVRELATNVEKYLNLDGTLLSDAAFVHDVGKYFTPLSIIDKPGRLTELEREVINLHAYLGYQMLKDLQVDEKICYVTLYHHGMNPPTLRPVKPCKDEDVIKAALMLHTIDEYEALTTDRSYRRGFSPEEALHIMRREENHNQDVLKFFEDVYLV